MQRQDFVDRAARPFPLSLVFMVALLVHAPLLLMQLPLKSYDTNFHIFFASHYAQHWFDPWNPKWYAGFSQTTYPPLPQQWIAIVSRMVGLDMGYMLVQFIGILLTGAGRVPFSSLWVTGAPLLMPRWPACFLGRKLSWFIPPGSWLLHLRLRFI